MFTIDIDAFKEPGLYLHTPQSDWLKLTRPEIEKRMRHMLDEPALIPPAVRAAAEYKPCDICPERDSAEICHAIMTTLPFAKEIDRYMSYQNVVAAYREPLFADNEIGGLYIRKTTMQEALQYIAMLSLLFYCEVGKKYYPYFANTNPLMPGDALSRVAFANIYLACNGDTEAISTLLKEMTDELLLTTRCQVTRLQLICHQDAFINAIVGTHTTVQMVMQNMQIRLQKLKQESHNR
ncbi:MAG: hypothetical protein ACNA71_05350 [Kiritimatiellia bacterium]